MELRDRLLRNPGFSGTTSVGLEAIARMPRRLPPGDAWLVTVSQPLPLACMWPRPARASETSPKGSSHDCSGRRSTPETIDRQLAPERAKLMFRGRSHTKPGTLLKSQIPVRTWAEWSENMPGFVEIDLVGHEGGNSFGEFCFTLTVTDIFTGWTINRSVKNKAAIWVFEALEEVIAVFPFPILGIDSDNGSEFINSHLLNYCIDHKITFTRSRPGNKNDGAHVEQKNWTHVRELVGYLRFDTDADVRDITLAA